MCRCMSPRVCFGCHFAMLALRKPLPSSASPRGDAEDGRGLRRKYPSGRDGIFKSITPKTTVERWSVRVYARSWVGPKKPVWGFNRLMGVCGTSGRSYHYCQLSLL